MGNNDITFGIDPGIRSLWSANKISQVTFNDEEMLHNFQSWSQSLG